MSSREDILRPENRAEEVKGHLSAAQRDSSRGTGQSRLPRSVGAQNGPMLIRPDPPGTVFQDETVGEAKGDAVEGDEGLAWHKRSQVTGSSHRPQVYGF